MLSKQKSRTFLITFKTTRSEDQSMASGKPHKSKDPREHVSMAFYDKNDKRLTSVHVYNDGTGKFSKDKYSK